MAQTLQLHQVILDAQKIQASTTANPTDKKIDTGSIGPAQTDSDINTNVDSILIDITPTEKTGVKQKDTRTSVTINKESILEQIQTAVKIEAGDDSDQPSPSRDFNLFLNANIIRKNKELSAILETEPLTTDASQVLTEDDLQILIAHTANKDTALEEVSLNFSKIKVSYKQPVKFLGLIPTTLTQRAEIEQGGHVKVKFPWYHIFYSKPDEIKPEAIKSAILDNVQLASMDLQNSLQKMAQAFQTLSSIMKTKHDTAKSIIQNIR